MHNDVINRMLKFLDTGEHMGVSRPFEGHRLETRAFAWPRENPCRFEVENKFNYFQTGRGHERVLCLHTGV